MPDSLDGGQSRVVDEDDCLAQHRIRHITSIQVRNLTPFPVRDAFATALSQPAEQPQFTAHGHLSDDLDLTLARKRSRRISVNSINTLRSARSNEGAMDDGQSGSAETRGRRRAGSRVSASGIGSMSASPSTARPTGSAPTIRNRPRTSSMTSSNSVPLAGSSSSATAALCTASTSLSAMLPDNSQSSLEKVIRSRLVETFVAITIPISLSGSSQPTSVSHHNSSPRSRSSTPPLSELAVKDKFSSPLRRRSATSIRLTASKAPPAITKRTMSPHKELPSPRLNATKSAPAHTRAAPTSSFRLNRKTPSGSSSISRLKPPRTPPSPTPRQPSSPSGHEPSIPNYLSPIHRPSTNPSFAIDPRSNHDFAEWTDLGSDQMKVEVWGRVGSTWLPSSPGRRKGKGKEVEVEQDPVNGNADDWKVLEEWNVHLADLVPLPEDLASHPSHLPSNTLLVTLSPTGQTYYLPPPRGPSTRASSPAPGYNSDPESAVRTFRPHLGDIFFPSDANAKSGTPRRTRRWRGGDAQKDDTQTAGWQDLFKLVTLQSCVLDTERSLADIVTEIHKTLAIDVVSPLKREISERESLLTVLREESQTVHDTSTQMRKRIESRRMHLQERRKLLSLAQALHNQDASFVAKQQEDVANQQASLASLRTRFSPLRTTILSTLSAIFPINPLSPPDLLFTILSVPLPIPVSSTDPAPPLSLPAHKDVNEDSIATSLGYIAQVVQLLAAYLGKGLVYPVTCIGSRSLIRDGISAMVGPRMFPLYSKGVDTYRFEYGVFLLNKDIEMLMTDRDLHALDMRHTLPNLMNLLLTLTDGEGARLVTPRSLDSPMSSLSGLESPRAESPPALKLTPASPPAIETELQPEGNTPPASGSTTPTASTSDSSASTRKSFLGFSPLTGFLRSRYPSVAATITSPPENGDHSSQSSGSTEGDAEVEEDRQTIRGVVMDPDAVEVKQAVNGHADGSMNDKKEKDREGPAVVNH